MTLKNGLRILAILVSIGFLLGVAVPLLVDRLLVNEKWGWKSEFISFQLKDDAGRRHLGYLAAPHALKDLLILEYGYEAPAGKNIDAWHKQIIGKPRDKVEEQEGFVWSDKGFLWGDYKAFDDNLFKEGTRLGLPVPPPKAQQLEITLPGAPWDIDSAPLSFLGKFPKYAIKFEDKNFKFDLNLSVTTDGWYMYNGGRPFQVGDFGVGSMNENAGDITGTITHKQTGERFNVTGRGLMEDASGHPWSWVEWGAHDWNDFHFAGGWSGALWKTKDDWQWGYHTTQLGWLWDPDRKTFSSFYRVDLIDVHYVTDPLTRLEYPEHATWRAIGPDGTLELKNTNLTFKPRESRFPLGPLDFGLQMSYGNNTSTARYVRRDGSFVDLSDGTGTMEHFNAAIPDYVFWGPLSLVALLLSWGAFSYAARRESGQSVLSPIVWSLFGLVGIALLNLAWSG